MRRLCPEGDVPASTFPEVGGLCFARNGSSLGMQFAGRWSASCASACSFRLGRLVWVFCGGRVEYNCVWFFSHFGGYVLEYGFVRETWVFVFHVFECFRRSFFFFVDGVF